MMMGACIIQERHGDDWSDAMQRSLRGAFRFRHTADARIRRYAERHGIDRNMFRLVRAHA